MSFGRVHRDWESLKKETLSLLREGKETEYIANKLGISRTTVVKWRGQHCILVKPKPKSNLTPPPYAIGYRWRNTKM